MNTRVRAATTALMLLLNTTLAAESAARPVRANPQPRGAVPVKRATESAWFVESPPRSVRQAPHPSGEPRIPGLQIQRIELRSPGADDGSIPPRARIRGRFTDFESELTYRGKAIATNPRSGAFALEVDLDAPITIVKLVSVDQFGDPVRERLLLEALPDEEAVAAEASSPNPANLRIRGSLTFATSLSSIGFRQTGVADTSTLMLTPKLDFRRQIGQSPWSVSANVFFTAVSLHSNLAPGIDLRFFGANWRIGRRISPLTSHWTTELSAGTYYETMFISGADPGADSFGFQNLAGPQLMVRTGRDLGARGGEPRSAGAYLKYALVSSNLKLMSLSNRELAAGLFWVGPVSGAPLVFSLDASVLDFSSGDQAIRLKSLSLGAGYRLSFL